MTRLPLLVACAVLRGCAASASPEWDARFGDHVRALQAQQLLDPAAPDRNRGMTPPADGRTVVEAQGRYTGSFRAPPPASVITIGVGGPAPASGGGN